MPGAHNSMRSDGMADDELIKLAATAMTAANNDRAKAASRMAAHIMKRRDLIQQLALYYLTHADIRGASAPSIDVSPHKVRGHKRRSPEQRTAALEAAGEMGKAMLSAFDFTILGRSARDIRVGELTALYDRSLVIISGSVQRNIGDVTQALVIKKLKLHAIVADHSSHITDVINERKFQALIDEAIDEAPYALAKGYQAIAESLNDDRTKQKVLT
jgi:hypothetical protein